MDRHWYSMTARKKVYFKEIGAEPTEQDDLSLLFISVYNVHHAEDNSVNSFLQMKYQKLRCLNMDNFV